MADDSATTRAAPHAEPPGLPTCGEQAGGPVALGGRGWLATALIVAAVAFAAPRLWERAETFDPGADYRIPHALSEDYWHFGRYARTAAGQGRIAVLGDSVIWGQYVAPEMTLSGRLNALTGPGRFANLGLDGAHPAALAGLIERHAAPLRGGRVVLHLNALWLATADRDLSGRQPIRFNHPRLVPQFVPYLRCYDASVSERLGVAAWRATPFRQWAGHLQAAYFGNADLPWWTVEHPYDSPLAALQRGLPAPAPLPADWPPPWVAGEEKADFPWVDLGGSLQWRSFRQAVTVLRSRGNEVFVFLGPFNEHILTAPSRRRYQAIQRGLVAWLAERGVPHLAPAPLPADLYADASHPLGPGYAALARQLLADEAFAAFAGAPLPEPTAARD